MKDDAVRGIAKKRLARRSLDHKSAQGRPAHVGLRAQDHVIQGSGDAETEQGGRNYNQGRGVALTFETKFAQAVALIRRLGASLPPGLRQFVWQQSVIQTVA